MNTDAIAKPVVPSLLLALLTVSGLFTPPPVLAQDSRIMRERERDRGRFETNHWRWNSRFNHNHYYPAVGYGVPVLPNGHAVIPYGRERYFYHGGVWFRFTGGRYLVIRPPLGIVLPVLPAGYTALRARGVPYYYVNDVYYVQTPQGYAVTDPPPELTGQTEPQPSYPSAQQPDPSTPPQYGSSPPQYGAPPPQYGTAPPPQAAPGMWYYCDPSRAYYPHVATCSQPWRPVPASPPPR